MRLRFSKWTIHDRTSSDGHHRALSRVGHGSASVGWMLCVRGWMLCVRVSSPKHVLVVDDEPEFAASCLTWRCYCRWLL